MALNAYLSVQGSTQGQFMGGHAHGSRKNQIPILGFDFGVEAPRDASTGMATGKRQHKPLTIIVESGPAAAQFLHAASTNEVLHDISIEFVKDGTPVVISLNEASIGSIRPVTFSTAGEVKHAQRITLLPEDTEFDFTYQKIEWTWTDGNKTAQDDWEARG